jgi:hypothetical protein
MFFNEIRLTKFSVSSSKLSSTEVDFYILTF